MTLRIATRPSSLARWQTQWVIASLRAAHPGLVCTEHVIVTQGDRTLESSLPSLEGKGLFTQALEAELLGRRVQAAVHSLKDLPINSSPDVTLGAVPVRADARDVLISANGHTLDSLPPDSVVGTSSLRRAAQILSARPDLKIAELRGNVETRLRKALNHEFDAIVLASAGLLRLGLESHITQWLPLEVMLPAPGQGALAVQCRADDDETLSRLQAIDDATTRQAVAAERAFLGALGGGCAVPVAAYAVVDDQLSTVSLTGLVAAVDGTRGIRVAGEGSNPALLGERLAQEALAQGADEVLAPSTES